jgi:acetyltransferase-like isoleucine patch superfamily enzyme
MDEARTSLRFGTWTRRMARWRGKVYRRLLPSTFAPGCMVGAGLVLEHPARARLGDGVILHHRVQLLCRPEAQLVVGAKTFMNTGSIVAANESIVIGEDVLLAPNALVIDADHEFADPDVAIARQGMKLRGPIVIGDGCWIAAGAVVLGGTELAPRSVVAANAVVRGVFPKRCVLAGAPAKVVRYLDDED